MNAVILMTKIPNKNSKTRLSTILSEEQRIMMSNNLIEKNLNAIKNYKVFLSLTPDELFYGYEKNSHYECIRQVGNDIGERMNNSIKEVLSRGYSKVILIGSDIIDFDGEIFDEAFDKLNTNDVVFSPTEDGGYSLIGMKKAYDVLFENKKYSNPNVENDLENSLIEHDLSYYKLKETHDVDTDIDFIKYISQSKNVKLLGKGEYNSNYLIDGDYLIRIARGSQMHLTNQIEYEYNALKFLEQSKVTPKVYDVKKDEMSGICYLTEEYLIGRDLNYHTDLEIAAYLLSQIHSLDVTGQDFIKAGSPFNMMFDEFTQMFSHYQKWDKKNNATEEKISNMLKYIKNLGLDSTLENPCLINTELNNKNFIIGDKSYVIDWEKPIIGEREQDLAHFLAPTTTFWKTDVIFDNDTMDHFLDEYDKLSKTKVDRKKFVKYLLFTCLRGITWCSMAYTQYVDDNRDSGFAFEKIKAYLSDGFLDNIWEFIKANDFSNSAGV
ncbi:MAG: TIGR04282 family arsenosugar biosynthesis glycosyltransferase [Finegoldia magna]|uniref:TIGR04282 family arsenosugar biosynthesis glycosyltransferase n=1 Tax=Finegoldia magna TaxID=1260 RepID=UPI00290C1A84|nr:TIGR04282 family arsenosugar biosynthesis glycosyltransferase [Finegoldia magna]MDU5960751.1 TIGR04282 family arsenosugar biosynthesis glycosyltransferase [Finegoldia magna]